MSTWTLDKPPTHLTWTNMDILLTTYPPLIVHVVIEFPLKRTVFNELASSLFCYFIFRGSQKAKKKTNCHYK